MIALPVFILFCAVAANAAEAIIRDYSHQSAVFGETRAFRIFLPPDYEHSGKHYPVIYWFHGWSERYNKPVADTPHRDYDSGSDYGGDTIAAFVGSHDVIVVKWDGYNPRTPGENYLRPYNISPVETSRQFPLYFPELVAYIDAHFRTIADREHRATSGLSMGGFMSFWVSGKYPDLVGSASNFMGSSEFYVGPKGFDVEYRHDEMHGNYEGMYTRLVTGSRDFIRFYHRRMNAVWRYSRTHHETEEFDSDHGTPGMAKTLAFHMYAFAHPLPRPAVWNHNDVYPNFTVWDWLVTSNRRQPGITALENVSRSGFRSSVREWLPDGRTLNAVKLSITSGPLYQPGKPQPVTIIRLRDGKTTRQQMKADAEGRLTFDLDGESYEVGIGPSAVPAISGFRIEGAAWAQAGAPVRLKVKFWNKGGSASKAGTMRWASPNPGVIVATEETPVPALEPGQSFDIPVAFTVRDESREIATLLALNGVVRLPVEVPLFPPAKPAEYELADGRGATVFQHAIEKRQMKLGEGNGDGHANPGERVAVLLSDSGAFRAAELFTNDACVDDTLRVSDVWGSYDHVGASVKYSLPLIRRDCPAGHVIHMLARVQLPNKPDHELRYGVIELPVVGASPAPPRVTGGRGPGLGE